MLLLPLLKGRGPQMLCALSSSLRFTPLSFHGLRSRLKLRVDSSEMREVLDTLAEPLNRPALAWELFLRRSKKDERDDMLLSFRPNVVKFLVRFCG